MGFETLIGLLHVMSKTHPWLIKKIGSTLLDHAPGTPTVFSIVKLANVDSDMSYSALRKYSFLIYLIN